MTVVEYEGRIVVVDTGLRFPTAEQLGIDLVLPDFAYLRERVDDIEAIVITHGHEDHLGALPWVLRELGETSIPVIYGGQLTVAMARSKLDEHKLREARLDVLPTGDVVEAGPVPDRDDPHDALDPRRRAAWRSRPSSGRCSSPATTSSTRRPSTARRPTSRGWPSSGARACCCSAATRRTPTGPGFSPSRVARRPEPRARLPPLRGPHRRHELRLEHPPRAAGRRRRRAARPQGRARRALDAQERQHRPHARPHQRPRGHARRSRARSTSSRRRSS